jgi:hypothetical protein
MTIWNNLHIYYTNLNDLVLSCIEPFFNLNFQKWPGIQYFWERHYAGGTHLRLRFTAPLEYIHQIEEALIGHVQTFLQTRPSVPIPTYSADKCRAMLALDGEDVLADDYKYRVNEVHAVPYQRFAHTAPSHATIAIIEDFLQDVRPLALWAISQPDAVRLNVLQLYFWTALFLCHDLLRGSVSYKSHWSGFAASCRNRALVDRIRLSYNEHKPQLAEMMCQVQACHNKTAATPPFFLAQWQSLLEKYSQRVSVEISNGTELTPRMKSADDVRKGREWVARNVVEESDFLNLLYDGNVNLVLLGQDAGMTAGRVLINLLYIFVPLAGLNFLDKMCLCHYAYRTVEDYFQCNLTDVANDTLVRLRAQNEIVISNTGLQ